MKTGLVSPLLIKAATYQSGRVCLFLPSLPVLFEYGGWANFSSYPRAPEVVREQLASQPGDWRNGPWERGIPTGDILRWPSTSVWQVAPMSDVCGLTCECRGALSMLTTVINLFGTLHVVHCGKEEKEKAAAVRWSTVGSSAGRCCPVRG